MRQITTAVKSATGGVSHAADQLRVERILEQVQALIRGEPIEPDPPELVQADLVAERLARIVDRAGAIAPRPAPPPKESAPEPSPYLTYAEAARLANKSVKTLQNAKAAGKLKGHGNGRGARFLRRDVERFMQSR